MLTTEANGDSTMYAGATVGEHGTLIPDKKLPLKIGEHVSLIIAVKSAEGWSPELDLRGTVVNYKNPFEPAVPVDDWEAGMERYHMRITGRFIASALWLLCGVLLNIGCCLVFRLAAGRITAHSTESTVVLAWAPLYQGALVAFIVVLGYLVSRIIGGKPLRIGLLTGILIQIIMYYFWQDHWLSNHN